MLVVMKYLPKYVINMIERKKIPVLSWALNNCLSVFDHFVGLALINYRRFLSVVGKF